MAIFQQADRRMNPPEVNNVYSRSSEASSLSQAVISGEQRSVQVEIGTSRNFSKRNLSNSHPGEMYLKIITPEKELLRVFIQMRSYLREIY